jgi:hypothetical protein
MSTCQKFTADPSAAATNVAAYLLISLRHLLSHLRHLFLLTHLHLPADLSAAATLLLPTR